MAYYLQLFVPCEDDLAASYERIYAAQEEAPPDCKQQLNRVLNLDSDLEDLIASYTGGGDLAGCLAESDWSKRTILY